MRTIPTSLAAPGASPAPCDRRCIPRTPASGSCSAGPKTAGTPLRRAPRWPSAATITTSLAVPGTCATDCPPRSLSRGIARSGGRVGRGVIRVTGHMGDLIVPGPDGGWTADAPVVLRRRTPRIEPSTLPRSSQSAQPSVHLSQGSNTGGMLARSACQRQEAAALTTRHCSTRYFRHGLLDD